MQPIQLALLVDNLAALSLIHDKVADDCGCTMLFDVQFMFLKERHVPGACVVRYVESYLSICSPSHVLVLCLRHLSSYCSVSTV
jgi:hypothetical protein